MYKGFTKKYFFFAEVDLIKVNSKGKSNQKIQPTNLSIEIKLGAQIFLHLMQIINR